MLSYIEGGDGRGGRCDDTVEGVRVEGVDYVIIQWSGGGWSV